jgi:acyl-coenzyme A synthetase/AMP-(fatty) acid ligase
VVNTLPNSPERVVCEAGIMLSGAASVNGQCLMADGSDLLRTLRVSRAKAIVVDPDVSGSPWNVLRHHVTLGNDGIVTTSPSLPDLKKVYVVWRVEGRGPGDLLATLESREAWFQNDDVTPDDAITVATTSGSSGFSKLVVVPHSHFTNMLKHFASHFADPTVLDFNMSPPGWMGGNMYYVFLSGLPRVTVDFRESGGETPENIADVVWRSLQEEGCTRAFLSPKLLPQLSALAEKNPASRKLKVLNLSGLPVSRSMVKAALSLADEISVCYASTDFGVVSMLYTNDWQTYLDHDTGKPSFGNKVKIVSVDDEAMEMPTNQVRSRKPSYI